MISTSSVTSVSPDAVNGGRISSYLSTSSYRFLVLVSLVTSLVSGTAGASLVLDDFVTVVLASVVMGHSVVSKLDVVVDDVEVSEVEVGGSLLLPTKRRTKFGFDEELLESDFLDGLSADKRGRVPLLSLRPTAERQRPVNSCILGGPYCSVEA